METDLFQSGAARSKRAPLAARMRPVSLDEFVGQPHILSKGKLLRRAIEADRIESLILCGPPGTGKTSLAAIISLVTQSHFERVNAVESSIAHLRRILAAASLSRVPTILFIDEIHRFNKAQQDILLPEVESGVVRLIGATTQNPFFCINSALVSRSLVFQLEPISSLDLILLGKRALADKERGLGDHPARVTADALEHLALVSDGDARRFLNALELAVLTTPLDEKGEIVIDIAAAEESIQKKTVVYDGDGDAHYDTISAFIKSIRGSDPDAALYWLAKMLHAGEDPRFIARRVVISASEDIGMADPHGLMVAVAAQQAIEFVGMPEAQLNLAHAVVYLATAPKSRKCCEAIGAALKDVRSSRTLAVPPHLRDAHYAGSERLGNGKGNKYGHNSEDGFVPQAYLPEGRVYYHPSDSGYEARVRERLEFWRAQMQASKGNDAK